MTGDKIMENNTRVPGLKPALLKRGLSQVELAEKIGVSKNTVSMWIRGKISPSLETLLLLVEILDVSADEILGIPSKAQIPTIKGLCRVTSIDGKVLIEIEPTAL